MQRPGADPAVGELAAFSPGGQALIYKSEQDAVRFLELPSGKPLHRFHPEDFTFWLVPFARDGKTVAAVRSDRTLCLYDAAAGQGLKSIDTKATVISSAVVFSPDGKLLAWVNPNGTVSVVETKSGQRMYLFGKSFPKESKVSLIAKGVYSVAFSPDGKALAAGGEHDNTIRLWNLETGKPFREFEGHQGPVRVVAFSRDGRSLASSGSWEREIRLWEVATAKERRKFQGHEDRATCLAFSPDGKLLASSSLDATVVVWEVR